jgi:hypothetical protein
MLVAGERARQAMAEVGLDVSDEPVR